MSSDIARGVIAKLRADKKRMDYMEKYGLSVIKMIGDKSWVVRPLNFDQIRLVAIKNSAREAIDASINSLKCKKPNEQRHAKNRRRA